MNEMASVDLTNCDREPIHILGAIQPFGFLMALTGDWLVSRTSANVADYIGRTSEELRGRPIATIFTDHALHAIRNRLAMLRGSEGVERLFALVLVEGGRAFDVAVHFSDSLVIVEAEPATADTIETTSLIRGMTPRLNQARDMTGFFREGARQVRALTGFDRVMVYRFGHDGAGEVVAEALRAGVDSFMGLNFPASDIPAQARRLYLTNIFRVIADVGATPVPILPERDAFGKPLDLSLSVLRAVSPIHIEYLRNMGVEASLSISIVVEGRLWGLFACHHYSPRLPSFAARSAAELFGQLFAMLLETRERREVADYEVRARSVSDQLMAAVAQDAALLHNAEWLGEVISGTIPCDGVGVFLDGTVSISGRTPNAVEFEELVRTLNQVAASRVFATESITNMMPEAAAFASRAAGLIAIPLSRSPRDYVVLFRSERLQSVRWAGNPDKPVDYGPNGARLTPRESFAEWSELVRGRSIPFTEAERRVAETLRTALLEVVLRLADGAGEERRRAHERQELLIAELNHRVRNILALIRGLISQTRDSAVSAADFVTTLETRIQALARAHDQITSDRWGPARLRDLVDIEGGAYLGAKSDRIAKSGPNVLIEPRAYTVLALVLHELMTNAAKYGALSDSGSVRIAWRLDPDGSLRLEWTEEGGPAVQMPERRGFGSTIIERSVPYDLGGDAEVNYRLSGLEARFRIPASCVAGVEAEPVMPVTPQRKAVRKDPKLVLGARHVLLVEDSMIIALDGEDALRALGAESVTTVGTAARGIAAVDEEAIGFALLDFNLGRETSLPVADRLAERGIPFLFATGYGDEIELPERHRKVRIVKKPYGVESLAAGIAPLLAG